MKQSFCMRVIPCFAAVVLALSAGVAGADDRDERDHRATTLNVRLSGFGEVPVISTTGKGSFKATIDPVSGNIDYTLSYSGLQGKVTQSHIHIGPAQNTGGIAVWLCQTATTLAPVTTPPSVVPTCPDPSGTVTGTITAAHVIGPALQLITAGQLDEVVAAIKAGLAYVNVHTGPNPPVTTTGVPGGEIRGQFRPHH
jgi:CHRD domain